MAETPTLQDLLDEYDSNSRSLHSFGAVGDGTIEEEAIAAAFSWLNEVRGRSLLIPAGLTFIFNQDKIVTQSNCSIIGVGHGQACLSGQNNARIILGVATEGPPGASGLPTKLGTKVVNTFIYNIGIIPASDHSGECLLIDCADSTVIEMCSIGPKVQSGATVTHGIKCNWTQWVYIRRNEINVNGSCIYIKLPAVDQQNEDHYHIETNQLYNGKGQNPSFVPCNIFVDLAVGRVAAIFEFEVRGNHFGRFMNDDVAITGGIRIGYSGSDALVGHRTFHAANILNNMFERVDFIVDFKRGHLALDASNVNFIGNTVLYSRGTTFNARDYVKSNVNVSGNYFLQGVDFVDGMLIDFCGKNDILSYTGTLFVTAVARHRYWNKLANACLTGLRLAQNVSVTVAAGATYADFPLSLAAIPSLFECHNLNGPNWVTTYAYGNVSATNVRVYFGTPAPAAFTVYLHAEVGEI